MTTVRQRRSCDAGRAGGREHCWLTADLSSRAGREAGVAISWRTKASERFEIASSLALLAMTVVCFVQESEWK